MTSALDKSSWGESRNCA